MTGRRTTIQVPVTPRMTEAVRGVLDNAAANRLPNPADVRVLRELYRRMNTVT